VEERIALLEPFDVVEARHLLDLRDPDREGGPPREELVEMLVQRHEAGQERERLRMPRGERLHGVKRAKHVLASPHAQVTAARDDDEPVGEAARIRLDQQRDERGQLELLHRRESGGA
jgi:hypothetical protein